MLGFAPQARGDLAARACAERDRGRSPHRRVGIWARQAENERRLVRPTGAWGFGIARTHLYNQTPFAPQARGGLGAPVADTGLLRQDIAGGGTANVN